MAKKDESSQEPVLDITDDLHETVPEKTDNKTVTAETDSDAVPAVEAEPPTRGDNPLKIEVKDPTKPGFKQKLADFLKTKKGKVVAGIVALLLIVGILLVIPATRYGILGIFIKKDVTLTVLDSASKKPVNGATVMLGTYVATTDADGQAHVASVPVGQYTAKIDKKYYESTSFDYLVPILSAPADTQPTLKATGRNVEISVTNKVNGTAVKGATVTISDSTVTTDSKGIANIILPVQAGSQKGSVKVSGYNDTAFEVTVENKDDQKQAVPITPTGTIYFLSKRTGTIDVMKSNLDGTDAQTFVAGTGQESDTDTVLLSTTDWKYLALLAKRDDSDKPKLYLIDTATGKLTVMDEGDVDFQLVGWSGHRFVYSVTRSQDLWADKRQALKSYDAEAAKLTTLDETQGSGTGYSDYATQSIGNIYIVDSNVIYSKGWDLSQYTSPDDRTSAIMTVGIDGSNKKSLKNFQASEYAYFEAKLYEPGGIYYRVVARKDNKATYYEYEDGAVTETADTNDAKFYNDFYATYLISPSAKKTFWYESRDGKNVLFVGDQDGNNKREIGTSDYTPYGWYTDDYLLLSRNGSELYIMGVDNKLDNSNQPLKVTDYHKPAFTLSGYGSGYGGQ